MLLVTFHGGPPPGINNVYAYDTANGDCLTQTALTVKDGVELSELRALLLTGEFLYVANGGKTTSNVLCYTAATNGSSFTFASTVIADTLSKKGHFETSIAHPFGLAFDNETCYVSNQDTNVVASVTLTNSGQTGSLGSGCQSSYLTSLFPSPDVFLDGTYVASQVGTLHHVEVQAQDVPQQNGGLGAFLLDGKVKNSVRDVAVSNGNLIVCDEVDKTVNLYSLADGSFLGSCAVATKPTHLTTQGSNLFVSAGSNLYWGVLPEAGAAISLEQVALPLPSDTHTIGGISFSGSSVYIPFQAATGTAGGGSIWTYSVSQTSPSTLPVFSNGAPFVASLSDTPEFVLYVEIGA